MAPFPTVFTLWYSKVHVSTTNCGNETSNIEPPIDKVLCFHTALNVPDVDPYDGHIRFGRYFDYSWFRSQDDIIEDVVVL